MNVNTTIVEDIRTHQDEAGQKAYEKKCGSTRKNVMTEGSGKWMSKDAVECCKPKIYMYVNHVGSRI
jgi:hypothetical protein